MARLMPSDPPSSPPAIVHPTRSLSSPGLRLSSLTSLVTTASMFCSNTDEWALADCNPACASFDVDVNSWDTAEVTTLHSTFSGASAFDHGLSACWTLCNWRDMSS